MKTLILTSFLLISSFCQAQGFVTHQEGCYQIDLDIDGRIFTDYLQIIKANEETPGFLNGSVQARLIVPVANAASTSNGTFRYHPWGGFTNYDIPFVIIENGRTLRVNLNGTHLIDNLGKKPENDFNGTFKFNGDEKSYSFKGKYLFGSSKKCGPF